MKRGAKYLIACLTMLVIVGLLVSSALSGEPKVLTGLKLSEEAGPPQVSEIQGYRSWTLVNPQPVHIAPQVSILCAAPMPPTKASRANDPHAQKLISVYVNEIGKSAMMNEQQPKFPIGSVVVKEKLPPGASAQPELLTVMVKRERGFNPESGDWEYMVTSGDGTKVEARGRLENCQACHVSMKHTDFVYRLDYLPEELRRKLR